MMRELEFDGVWHSSDAHPEMWDVEVDEHTQAKRDRMDEEDWLERAGEPAPTEAEMEAARATSGWVQGMEAEPYQVGFPAATNDDGWAR